MANLTQVSPGGVDRPDVALKEDLDAVVQTANNAKTQSQETADFLETRVPIGRTINSLPLDADIVITADDLDTYDKETIDAKLKALEAGGYNPVHVNGHLLDRDVILSAGDIGTYSSSEIDNKVAGLVPTTRTINGEALSADVVLAAGDVGAYTKGEVDSKLSGFVPGTRTINGVPLSDNVILQPSDIGSPKTADVVPRTFKINGQTMTGDSLTISAGDSYTRTEIDNKLSTYLPVQNEYGLGLEPESVTDGSFSGNVQGSGFYEYAEGKGEDANGNTVATSVSDRPTGSNSGRVVILTNAATFDDNGNITTPAVQDLLAFPNDLEGLWVKKNGQSWKQLGISNATDLPFPNVWAPLNDTVAITAGNAPYDTITVGSNTIDLNSKSVTFSRSTTATYVDNAGILRTADVDEARFERQGILIEGPSTNAVVSSNSFTSWGKTTNSSVTENAAVGPDAVSGSASKLSLSATSGECTLIANVRSDSFDVNGYVACSVFVKAGERSLLQISVDPIHSSTPYANFDLINGVVGGSATNASIQKLANGWYRCSIVTPATSVPASGSIFYAYLTIINSMSDTRAPTTTGNVSDGLFLFGAQVEALPFSSSYFTSGSISSQSYTRSPDMVSMQGAVNWNDGPFTLSAEIHTNWDSLVPNVAPSVFDLGGSTSGDYVSLSLGVKSGFSQVTSTIGDTNKGSTAYSAVQAYSGRSVTVAMRYSGTNLKVVANQVPSGDTAVPYVIGNSSSTLRIGGQTVAGTRHLFGHVKNFRVWHRALKDNEVNGLQ